MNVFQTATAGVTAVLLFVAAIPSPATALDWVPTNEEMAKYRESWNPPTHGSSFTTSADLSRQGQWYVRFYVQGQIGSGEFENNVPLEELGRPLQSRCRRTGSHPLLWVDPQCESGGGSIMDLLAFRQYRC